MSDHCPRQGLYTSGTPKCFLEPFSWVSVSVWGWERAKDSVKDLERGWERAKDSVKDLDLERE